MLSTVLLITLNSVSNLLFLICGYYISVKRNVNNESEDNNIVNRTTEEFRNMLRNKKIRYDKIKDEEAFSPEEDIK